jgi:UDP-N-acetylglucosamine:LPS N-acetylglucosamine transferase
MPALPAQSPEIPHRAAPAAPRRKVMAVSSGGGHWVELRRLSAAFAGLEVVYVSTDASAAAEVPGARHYAIRNVSRRDRFGFAVLAWQLARILVRERPDVVVTTGAAPGFVALLVAKSLFGCRTIWIDSIASVEAISLSARLARPVADAWLVQWAHLARPDGPEYWGAVL